jgi:hypothetical protein
MLTRSRALPLALITMPADGSTVLHMCRRPAACCTTCAYHRPNCRHVPVRVARWLVR